MKVRFRLLSRGIDLVVFHDPHDPVRLTTPVGSELPPHRIRTGPVPRRHRLGHHGNPAPFLAIRRFDPSPGQDAQPERIQVVLVHAGAVHDVGTVRSGRLVSVDENPEPVVVQRLGYAAGQPHDVHLGQFLQPKLPGLDERPCLRRVVCIHLHGQREVRRPARVVAEIDPSGGAQAANQQRAAHQEHERNRHLGDDEHAPQIEPSARAGRGGLEGRHQLGV